MSASNPSSLDRPATDPNVGMLITFGIFGASPAFACRTWRFARELESSAFRQV
jgi:hypothetical protein